MYNLSIKRGFGIAILILCSSITKAQENLDMSVLTKIRDEEFSRSKIPEISQHFFDGFGPRLTNSPGFFNAAHWIVSELKSYGISNATLEPWGVFGKGWELKSFNIALAKPYYQPIIAQPLGWTESVGPITAPLITVMVNGSLDKFLTEHAGQIRGKFVLLGDSVSLVSPFDPFASRYTDSALANIDETYTHTQEDIDGLLAYQKKMAAVRSTLKEAGVIAILKKQKELGGYGTIEVDDAPGKNNFRKGYPSSIPEIVIATEDFNKLTRMEKNRQGAEVFVESKTAFYENDLTGYNVIGEIPGTDPVLKDQVVMIGAHLDSWPAGSGATDDGAGCVVMMEVMRLFKVLNLQSRRTIRIGLWSGEEQGSLGSSQYVMNHFWNPATKKILPEQAKISVYYNLDNGTGRIRGIFAQNNSAVKSIFEQWLVPYKDLGVSTVTLHNTGSTDHETFDAVNIPAFQFIQDPLEYDTRTHHTNIDVYDHLYFEDLKQAAVVITGFVYQSANRPQLLPRKKWQEPEKFPFE
jgi:carboxypeptidase Q